MPDSGDADDPSKAQDRLSLSSTLILILAAGIAASVDQLPAGIKDNKRIPGDPWLILAYERNGRPLDPSSYEKGTGRLAGEGPYRLVKPQRDLGGDPSRPGRPDRSQKFPAFGDGWDFVPGMDHNAGACIRGACVIRINPMPEGYEDYDWKNGWPLIGDRKVVIYGRGVR